MENSVYTVTPPSLHLNKNGPSVMVIGFSEDELKVISAMFEQLYDISITIFYLNGELNELNAAWARAVSSMAEFIIVNPSTIGAAESYLVTSTTMDRPATLFWVAPNAENTIMFQMINSFISDQPLLTSFTELAVLLGVPEIDDQTA